MISFLGFGGWEYLLILLATGLVALPVIAVLLVVIRTVRKRGTRPPETNQ